MNALPWILGAYHFSVRCSINVFFILFQTEFFVRAGVHGLPYVYTAMNVVYIILQFASLQKLHHRSSDYLLRACGAWFLAVLARIIWFPDNSLAVATLYLLGIMVFELFFNQFFVHFLSDLFPLQDAKRHLPTIAAFGSLSCIASGVLLKLVLGIFPIGTILAGNLVLFGVSSLGFVALRVLGGSSGGGCKAEGPAPDAATSRVEDFGGWPLVKALATLSALNMVGKYWLDYQYSVAINKAWPTASELASFIAIFTAVTDAAVLFSQATLSGWALRSGGLVRTLGVMPIVVAALSLFIVVMPGTGLVLATQFAFSWLAKSFYQPSFSVVLGVLSSEARLKGMSTIGIASSCASMFASLVLIAVQDRFGPPPAFLALAAVFAVMASVVRKVDSIYAQEVVSRLDTLEEIGDPALLESLVALSPAEKRRRVERVLAGSEADQLSAISELSQVSPRDAGTLLLRLVEGEASPRVRASAARVIGSSGGREAACHLWKLSQGKQLEPRVLANLLESLADLDAGDEIEREARTFLNHPHHRVQAAAAYAVIRWARGDSDLEAPLAALWRMLTSDDALTRAAAVASLGNLQHEAFIPEIRDALSDKIEAVRRQAAKALEKIRTAEAAKSLRDAVGFIQPPALSDACATGASRLERLQVETVLQILDNLGADERMRAAELLSSLPGDPRGQLLWKILRLRDESIRRGLTSLLSGIPVPGLLDALDKALANVSEEVEWKEDVFSRMVLEADCNWFQSLETRLPRLLGSVAPGLYDRILALLLRRIVIEGALLVGENEPIGSLEGPVRRVLGLAANRCPDPAFAADALSKARGHGAFVASLSTEYFERHLGREVAYLLADVLNGLARPSEFPLWLAPAPPPAPASRCCQKGRAH